MYVALYWDRLLRKKGFVKIFHVKITGLILAIVWVFSSMVAQAQSLIRDTEIEEMLRDFTNPLLRAAGLQTTSVDLYIVNDPSLNAFVTHGQNIFIHTGTILEAATPNQLKGVIAHEAGHIAAGHIVRGDQGNKSAYGSMLIAAGVGIAAILAGEGEAGAAILAGSQQFGTISILAYTRANEAAADQLAEKYLEASGQSGRGLLQFFEKFRYQELLSGARRYPYFQSHPLSNERIDKLRSLVEESPFKDVKDTDEEIHALKMAQAKLIGFIDAPQTVFSKFPESDTSKPARYARSVSYYRAGDLKEALREINSLIKDEPDNPYFYELKGQMLYESGKGADAIAPLHKAIALKPDAALIRIALGQALIERNTPETVKEGVKELKLALRREPQNGFAWYQLSQGYDRLHEPSLARYAIAEQAFSVGNYQRARSFAQRAQAGLANDRTHLRRVNDILVISETQLARQKQRRR